MQLWKLFITALMAVLKVLLITAVGAFLGLDRFNLLRESARKHLNALVYFVFAPALVCSILTKTITFRSLVMLWFMPLNILLTFVVGTALGWLLMKISKAPHGMQGLVLGCCAAGNQGNLPLIIVPAVCKESSTPFGAVDACHKKAMAYASLSLAVGSIYFWTFVYNIVRAYSCNSSNINKVDDSTLYPVAPIETDPENYSTPSTGPPVNAEDFLETVDHETQLEIERTSPDRRAKVPKHTKIMKTLKTLVEKLNLKVLLSPGTIGAIVGLIIGVVPPLRKLFAGDNAPLRVVEDSVSMLGDACIPAITLLLGANLLKGLKGSGMKVSLVVGIIVVRCIALPALGVGIIKGAVHFGMIHDDPLYQFILLLQFAVPPALNISKSSAIMSTFLTGLSSDKDGVIGTITQLFGAGETECSIIMLATYACASVSLTLWSTFFMWLVL